MWRPASQWRCFSPRHCGRRRSWRKGWGRRACQGGRGSRGGPLWVKSGGPTMRHCYPRDRGPGQGKGGGCTTRRRCFIHTGAGQTPGSGALAWFSGCKAATTTGFTGAPYVTLPEAGGGYAPTCTGGTEPEAQPPLHRAEAGLSRARAPHTPSGRTAGSLCSCWWSPDTS